MNLSAWELHCENLGVRLQVAITRAESLELSSEQYVVLNAVLDNGGLVDDYIAEFVTAVASIN